MSDLPSIDHAMPVARTDQLRRRMHDLPDAAIQESRERVQAAVRNAGVLFPRKRLVVNLAPAAGV